MDENLDSDHDKILRVENTVGHMAQAVDKLATTVEKLTTTVLPAMQERFTKEVHDMRTAVDERNAKDREAWTTAGKENVQTILDLIARRDEKQERTTKEREDKQDIVNKESAETSKKMQFLVWLCAIVLGLAALGNFYFDYKRFMQILPNIQQKGQP